MVDYKAFNFEHFDFDDEASWERRLSFFVARFLLPRLLFPSWPVYPKKRESQGKEIPIEDFANAVGLCQPGLEPIFRFHKRRLESRQKISNIVGFVSSLIVITSMLLGVFLLTDIVESLFQVRVRDSWITLVIGIGLLMLLFYLSLFVIASIGFRLALAVTNKYYAESLCVLFSVFIVVDLSREDILSDPRKRTFLITRVEDLATVTRLLGVRYSSGNKLNQKWITSHFRQLEQYILDRARWAVAPTNSTLDALRQDFYKLAEMYVEGNYGSFSWDTSYEFPERTLTSSKQVFRTIFAVIGVVGPPIAMVWLLRRPDYLQSLGVSKEVIGLILIAWLLLAIDGALKLGVVAGIANLAKEIKNLK